MNPIVFLGILFHVCQAQIFSFSHQELWIVLFLLGPFLDLSRITVVLFLGFIVNEALCTILPLLLSFFILPIIVGKILTAALVVILF